MLMIPIYEEIAPRINLECGPEERITTPKGAIDGDSTLQVLRGNPSGN